MFNDPWSIAAAIIAVTLVGLAKGGFSGIGTLAMPILALAVSPIAAAAILLPIIIVQDVVSVWVFRHEWDKWIVGWMLPGALIGIVIGWAYATIVPLSAMLAALGLITLSFGLWRLWIQRGGRTVARSSSPGWVGTLFGIVSGFTSQVAHAGVPPFQMWVMPRHLPHLRYVGTAAVLFAIMNWAKLPAYIALGALTHENLRIAALLMPVAIASTLAGVWIARRIDPARFNTLIYLLMVLLGIQLLWEGITT